MSHAYDIRYQAPPLFSRVLQKIGELGDEVKFVCKIDTDNGGIYICAMLCKALILACMMC